MTIDRDLNIHRKVWGSLQYYQYWCLKRCKSPNSIIKWLAYPPDLLISIPRYIWFSLGFWRAKDWLNWLWGNFLRRSRWSFESPSLVYYSFSKGLLAIGVLHLFFKEGGTVRCRGNQQILLGVRLLPFYWKDNHPSPSTFKKLPHNV